MLSSRLAVIGSLEACLVSRRYFHSWFWSWGLLSWSCTYCLGPITK